jgi:hypothetical protein
MYKCVLFDPSSGDLPGLLTRQNNDKIFPYYCLMTKWSGLGDNTELSWAVLSQVSVLGFAA